MRVLLAFDKFKDALSARQACASAAAALRSAHPDWTLDTCPLTDGGEGFAEILTEAARGRWPAVQVAGPRGRPLATRFGLVSLGSIPASARALLDLPATLAPESTVALVEMAAASGLALLPPAERDPWQTTTLGTGELIREAAAAGAKLIVLGVGGSATNDLGLGALSALGLRFLSAAGDVVASPIPSRWPEIARINGHLHPPLPPIRIACDVSNPLLGPHGAAAIYGPQKGLRAGDLDRLETGSRRLATLLCAHAGRPAALMDQPGAGAAGGIAFGLMAAAGAQLLPGADFVAAWLDLGSRLAAADLVLTGEGTFDQSSLSGKGPGALVARALARGKAVHVFAGRLGRLAPTPPALHLHAITPAGMPLPEALSAAPQLLGAAVTAAF
ncbi:MAG: glycerate kinase [Opitutales bacterium]